MLPHFLRCLPAAAMLLLMAAPGFAQPPPPPPPEEVPTGHVPPPPVIPGSDDAPAGHLQSAVTPASAEEPEQAVDPIYRAWDLLSQPPTRTQHSGFPQPTLLAPEYRVTWFPEASVLNQNTNITVVREDFSCGIPVWKDECSLLGLSLHVHNEILDTHAVLPATNQRFPDQLWDVRLGVNYMYKFENGWSAGGTVTFGSASDRPFASIDELTASVMAFLRIPVGDHNAWLFSVMYSPTGELNFPVPGVAFYWQPADNFNATIGIPFKVWWQPVEDLTLEASYMPLTTVNAKVSYRVWGGVSIYTAYNRGNESYFLYNSPSSNDRFFYYDQRVTGGVKCDFGRQCTLDLSAGYAFDRHYFEGHTFSDNSNKVDVESGAFLSLMFLWRF
jgi:hypothetical protein